MREPVCLVLPITVRLLNIQENGFLFKSLIVKLVCLLKYLPKRASSTKDGFDTTDFFEFLDIWEVSDFGYRTSKVRINSKIE